MARTHLDPGDSVVELLDVAGELLPQSQRRRILEVKG